MMFMSLNSFKAPIMLVTLSLTSTFSARCIVKVRILSIFSISKLAKDSSSNPLFLAISKCLKHASTTVFPVIIRFSCENPSASRLMADSSVGMKYIAETISATLRFISSGIVMSNDLSPAST